MPAPLTSRALAAAAVAFCMLLGTGNAVARVSISISPTYAQLIAGRDQQFTATVSGNANTGVIWQVNNAMGGATETGTISSSGLYASPQQIPDPALVTITAIAKADRSHVRRRRIFVPWMNCQMLP